jgi:hypothetical protein
VTPLPEATATASGSGQAQGDRGYRFLLWVVPLLVLSTAAIVWAVAAGGEKPRDPETIEIIVPAGTQDRLAAGEKVVVMPARLEFRVGDRIFIRNEDDVAQSVGPYLVEAGEEMLLQYGAPGVYEGYCPLSEGERYEIVVTE